MKIIPVLLSFILLTLAPANESLESKPDSLAVALTSSNWSWENTDGGTKSYEQIQFYQGGIAQNPKFFSARWEVTGPHTVVLHNTNVGTRNNGKKAYLVFDAAFIHFIGFDFNGKTIVEGFRREALDPNRPFPQPKEAESKCLGRIGAAGVTCCTNSSKQTRALARGSKPITRLF